MAITLIPTYLRYFKNYCKGMRKKKGKLILIF